MHTTTIDAIQASWRLVLPRSTEMGQLFYKNLFEADPDVRALFRGDMQAQAAKLVQMIDFAVGKLSAIDELVPALQSLGARHEGYGVRAEHYGLVGAALLRTLEQGLGAAYTLEIQNAWKEAYAAIASIMTDPRP